MNVIFRTQHGDVGPWDVPEGDVSYQSWQEHVFERWPNSTCRTTPAERAGEGDEGEDELDGSTCRPSVSRAGVETKDDIKFIWNGHVLGTTEELQEVCLQYFGSVENTSRPAGGRGGTTNPDADAANKVLILHAVVRPPMAPGKRKGKGVEGAAGGSQGRGQQQGDGVCSCCVIS